MSIFHSSGLLIQPTKVFLTRITRGSGGTMKFFYFCGTRSSLVVAVTIKFVMVLGFVVGRIFASESDTSIVQVTRVDSSGSKGNTTNGTRKLEKCDNRNLSQCWNQIPPFPDQGIPSSPQGVEAACRYDELFPSA